MRTLERHRFAYPARRLCLALILAPLVCTGGPQGANLLPGREIDLRAPVDPARMPLDIGFARVVSSGEFDTAEYLLRGTVPPGEDPTAVEPAAPAPDPETGPAPDRDPGGGKRSGR